MNKRTGPFDVWLYQLAGELSGTFFSTEHPEVALKWLKDRLPLALLEAAENTDIWACLKFLERINEDSEMRDEQGLLIFPLAQICNFLRKALPDKEKK
jgi:hypothetical protein